MTPSHRLKLQRANQHLDDIKMLTEPLSERREYPVIETMQPQKKGPVWEYVLDLSSVDPPPLLLPILIGDYLFNVRSALDHLLVAIAPRKYRGKVNFPIHRADPLARKPSSGNYVNAEAAARWLSLCNCLPDGCIAPLTMLQPYHAAALHSQSADWHALALLSSLQNADKHRELISTIAHLSQVEVHINGNTDYAAPRFKDGTKILTAPEKMDVHVKGVAAIGIMGLRHVRQAPDDLHRR